jgi:hypothetical protein
MFAEAALSQTGEGSYDQLRDRYGVRRSDPGFWAFSDELHADLKKIRGLEAGLVDYNRLENR